MTISRHCPSCARLYPVPSAVVRTRARCQDFYWPAGLSSVISRCGCSHARMYIFPCPSIKVSRSFTPSLWNRTENAPTAKRVRFARATRTVPLGNLFAGPGSLPGERFSMPSTVSARPAAGHRNRALPTRAMTAGLGSACPNVYARPREAGAPQQCSFARIPGRERDYGTVRCAHSRGRALRTSRGHGVRLASPRRLPPSDQTRRASLDGRTA